jgi:hypothetical protein
MKVSSVVLGMSIQALLVSMLWKSGLIVASPLQQLLAACVFCVMSIVLMILKR